MSSVCICLPKHTDKGLLRQKSRSLVCIILTLEILTLGNGYILSIFGTFLCLNV